MRLFSLKRRMGAPRFENVEEDLQDGCFLTAGVGATNTTKLTATSYFPSRPGISAST
jgi:hypothetical protein